jgi:cation-transporting ATPase E
VFNTVLPALALWFAAMTAAYRFRLLDRMLGLAALPPTRPDTTLTGAQGATADA